MSYDPIKLAVTRQARSKAIEILRRVRLLGLDCEDLGEEVDGIWRELERSAIQMSEVLCHVHQDAGGDQ